MKANKGLRALINAALYAIKIIIAEIVARLLARKNNLKAVSFKFIFAGCHDLPGKVGFTLAITLSARIHPAMSRVKCNNPHITRGTLSIGGNAIGRIGAFQCLLNRLGFNGIAIAVRIVNRSALRIHGAIDNRKRIIPVREIHYMFSAITLQNIGYRSQKVSIGFQRRAEYKSSRITSGFRCNRGSLYSIGTYIVKRCGSKDVAVIGSSKGDNLISPAGKARVGKIYILERGINRFSLLMVLIYINAKILISRFVNVRCRR